MPQTSFTLKPPRRTGPPRPRRRWYPLLAICGLLTAVPALGMGIASEDKVIARSTDGQSALHEVQERGPEGGGRLTYRLSGPAGQESFLVSSDLSPGGSSKPQRVTEAECSRRLSELAGLLGTRGFSGVTVHPERCHGKSRYGLLTVSKT